MTISGARRVAVTGGTGFIGANLTRRLLAEGHQVHLLVRAESPAWRLADLKAELEWHRLDLADATAVSQLVARIRPDWLFHLAAYGSNSTETDSDQIFRTNLVGTFNLVRACVEAGCGAFINAGSSSEYGLKDHAPKEEEWLQPNSMYAVTKAASTLLCRQLATGSATSVVTLRLYSIYGPYEGFARLVPALIMAGQHGRLPPLVNAEIARDFVYVDDAVEAMMLAARCGQRRPGEVYNVGTGRQTTIREAVEIVRRVMAIEQRPRWGSMPDRAWDANVWVSDSGRIQQHLGWTPRYGFEQGLRRTIAWFERPEIAAMYSEQRRRCPA